MSRIASSMLLFCVVLFASGASAAELLIQHRFDLPDGVSYATDIRWSGPDSLVLLAPRNGLMELGTDGVVTKRHPIRFGRFADCMAASKDEVLVASLNDEILWWNRRDGTTKKVTFPTVSDLDFGDNTLFVLGLQASRGVWSPDGVVAWAADGRRQPVEWKPLLRMSSPKQQVHFVNCFLLQVGVIRLLSDGTVLIAPGADEGIVRLTRDGHRLQAWTGADVPFDSPCRVSMAQAAPMGDPEARAEWSNSRRILDELVALPDGFGAIVRYSRNGVSMWELVRYRFDGNRPERIPVPFRSEKHYARVRADANGLRIAMLIVDRQWHVGDERVPDAVVIMELRE